MNAYYKFKEFMTEPEMISLSLICIVTILIVLLLIKVSI